MPPVESGLSGSLIIPSKEEEDRGPAMAEAGGGGGGGYMVKYGNAVSVARGKWAQVATTRPDNWDIDWEKMYILVPRRIC